MPKAHITGGWMDGNQSPGLYWDNRHHGLGARVGKSGTKSWVFQKSGGRRATLGRWPDMDVIAARLEAAKLNATPLQARSQLTLREAMEAKIARLKMDGRSAGTIENIGLMLRKHVGDCLDRPLREITRGQLGRLHERVGAESGTYAANNLLRTLRTIHNHAMQRDTIVEDLPAWWAGIQRAESPIVRDWWLFVLYTGLRKNDALTARHSLITDGVLHLPEPKGGKRRAFDLPLSSQALHIVERQPRLADWVWPGKRDGHHLTTARVPSLRDMPGPHMLRRTWATHAEMLGCPRAIISKLLNHTGKRDVTSRYIKPDMAACRDWAQKVADKIHDEIS